MLAGDLLRRERSQEVYLRRSPAERATRSFASACLHARFESSSSPRRRNHPIALPVSAVDRHCRSITARSIAASGQASRVARRRRRAGAKLCYPTPKARGRRTCLANDSAMRRAQTFTCGDKRATSAAVLLSARRRSTLGNFDDAPPPATGDVPLRRYLGRHGGSPVRAAASATGQVHPHAAALHNARSRTRTATRRTWRCSAKPDTSSLALTCRMPKRCASVKWRCEKSTAPMKKCRSDAQAPTLDTFRGTLIGAAAQAVAARPSSDPIRKTQGRKH